MVFSRRVLTRTYADDTRYRPLLREDFRHRCAYCLRHEFFVGGEAGCSIDHHRPQRGPYGRPDLASVYENLYWCCSECNSIKGDTWPTPEQYAAGDRFLDPCQPEDDHDLHGQVEDDGTLTATTRAGRYTNAHLVLDRDVLVYHRRRQREWGHEVAALSAALETRRMDDSVRAAIQARLDEIRSWIEPPTFHRVRRHPA